MSADDNLEGKVNAVANLARAVPIYEDAVQPFAKQAGKAAGTVGELVNAALLPVRGFVWGAEQVESWVQNRVGAKLAEKNPDEIVSPDLSIAGPTIEALKFRGYEAEISELFANLLANNMVESTKSRVHPTFVEVIKELTPLEAKLFASCIEIDLIPVAGYEIEENGIEGGSLAVYPFNDDVIGNAQLGRQLNIDEWQTSIENLQRLGFVTISTDEWYTSDRMKEWYKRAEQHPIAEARRAKLTEDQSLVLKKGTLRITQLGKNFSAVVLRSP